MSVDELADRLEAVCGEQWILDRAGGSVQSGIFLKADSGAGILQRINVNDEKDRSVRNDLLIFSETFRLRKEPGKSPGSCFPGISVKEKPEDLLTKIYVPGKVENPKLAMLTLHDFRSNIKSVAEAFPLNDRSTPRSIPQLYHPLERMAGCCTEMACGATVAAVASTETVSVNQIDVRPEVDTTVPKLLDRIRTGFQCRSAATLTAGDQKILAEGPNII